MVLFSIWRFYTIFFFFFIFILFYFILFYFFFNTLIPPRWEGDLCCIGKWDCPLKLLKVPYWRNSAPLNWTPGLTLKIWRLKVFLGKSWSWSWVWKSHNWFPFASAPLNWSILALLGDSMILGGRSLRRSWRSRSLLADEGHWMKSAKSKSFIIFFSTPKLKKIDG